MKSTMKVLVAVVTFTAYVVFTSFISDSNTNIKPDNCGTYDVQLVSNTSVGGQSEWVWAVSNPNPGNGTNCTLQDLSHWSIVLPECIQQDNIVETAYSHDGVGWVNLSSTIGVDPSQDCYSGPVLKFDVGTNGNVPTYYKLVVNSEAATDFSVATFKSGKRTGCHTYADLVQGPACTGEGTIR